MSRVYYNEFDRKKAAWLRNLIEEGLIADGIVDERSITEVEPDDLAGFSQHHFFAGIGLWSLCLRRAGWPDDRPVWTGSCPCGPFSEAGKGLGFDDPRHLWPEWFRLIRERRPDVVFGEQSANAVEWIDLVSSDLEGISYAIGTPDIPAAGFGGAHKRQRFGFVADTDNTKWWSDRAPWHDGHWPQTGRVQGPGDLGNGGTGLILGDAGSDGLQSVGSYHGQVRGLQEAQRQPEHGAALSGGPSQAGGMGDPFASRLSDAELGIVRRPGRSIEGGATFQPGRSSGAGLDWLFCRDSSWRPVESGTCPLVDESPERMGRLRGFGDGIDTKAFENLIGAYLDAAPSPWRQAA